MAAGRQSGNGVLIFIAGILFLGVAGVFGVAFYFQTFGDHGAGSEEVRPAEKDGTGTIEPGGRAFPSLSAEEERRRQEVERKRREAVSELNRMRGEAANEFRQLAETQGKAIEESLRSATAETFARADGRVAEYAAWLTTWEATWEVAKAWWNDELSSYLGRVGEERLLSARQIEEAWSVAVSAANRTSGERAEEICARHENRFAGLLASLDAEVRVGIPAVELPASVKVGIRNPAVSGSLTGISSFLGSCLIASYGEARFVQWLGPKIALKVPGKAVKAGGLGIGLIAGYVVEKGIDNYYIRPGLEERLRQQLKDMEVKILQSPNIVQIVGEQAQRFRAIADEIERPVIPAEAGIPK